MTDIAWTKRNLTWAVSTFLSDIGLDATNRLLDQNFATWQAAQGSLACSRATLDKSPDIFFSTSRTAPNGYIGRNESGVAPVAISSQSRNGSQAQCAFNLDYPWDDNVFLIRSLHEIGHLLGLVDHSVNPDDVMFDPPTVNTTLGPSDLTRIQALYGPPKGVPTVPTIQIDCPDTVAAGATFPVTFTVTNDGLMPWPNDVIKIGSQQPQDNFFWGTNRILLPSPVPAVGSISVTVNLKAKSGSGPFAFAWQMVNEGVAWFGPIVSKTITVTPADQPAPVPVPSGPPAMTVSTLYQGQQYVGDVAWRKA